MPSQLLNHPAEFKNCKRTIELYLRAFWGQGFYLKQINQELDSSFSYLINNEIYLPEKISSNSISNKYYRAAAMHASLHAIYSLETFEVKELNLMQRTVIGLVEDLRIELLAIKEFPGLRSLWLKFHSYNDASNSALNLMLRLSKAILDPHYKDKSQWVKKGRRLILSNDSLLHDANLFQEIALSLANDLGQMRLPMNSGMYEQAVMYRDDNRCIWQVVEDSLEHTSSVQQNENTDVRQCKLKESLQGNQLKFTEDLVSQGNGLVVIEKETALLEYNKSVTEMVDVNVMYPEWDYRSHVLKDKWCNVTELHGLKGSEDIVETVIENHKSTLNRLRHIAKKLRLEKRQRQKKLEDGDDIDLASIIDAMVSIRSTETPDPRVFMRDEYHHIKSLSISMLMDLSESTNEIINSANISVAELMRDAVLLLGETLDIAGEEYAISGFSSNGRHDIKFTKFKRFDENFNECRNKLANIKGEYSTRLGAAIRHAGYGLQQRSSTKKLLLVITDGVPSDIDVYDERYLEHDSWYAVKTLSKQNTKVFCISLDASSTPAIEHIFGKGRFRVLDNITRLPEVLSEIYIKYARH